MGAGTVSDQGNGGGLAAVLGLTIALVCVGGLFLALYRRRSRPSLEEPAIAADPVDLPHLDVLADPLLEAMASSARARRPGNASKRAPTDAEPRVPTWVERLDAEINTLVDLRASPSPPPHDPIDGPAGDGSRLPEPGPTTEPHLRVVGR
jgi:hypothetical protein